METTVITHLANTLSSPPVPPPPTFPFIIFENGEFNSDIVYNGFDFNNMITQVGPDIYHYDSDYGYGYSYLYFRLLEGLNPPGVIDYYNTGQGFKMLGVEVATANTSFAIVDGNLKQHSAIKSGNTDYDSGILIPISLPKETRSLGIQYEFNDIWYPQYFGIEIYGIIQLLILENNNLRKLGTISCQSTKQSGVTYTKTMSLDLSSKTEDSFVYMLISSQTCTDTMIKKIWIDD